MKITFNDIKYLVSESVRRIIKESQEQMTPAVYVGTYGKYNGGSLQGEWVNLTDFDSKEEFIQYCRELHKDEPDAELMFQDYEYVPQIFIDESYIDERFWDFLNDTDHDYDIKYAVANNVSSVDDYFNSIDDIMVFWDCDDMTDVAYYYIDEGILPSNPQYYFDYERYGRDCSFDGPSDDSEFETIYDEYGVDEDDDEALGEVIVDEMGGLDSLDKQTIINYMDLEKLGRDLSFDGHWVEFDRGMIEIM